MTQHAPQPHPLRRTVRALALAAIAILAACSQGQQTSAPPAPHTDIADAVGHYCGMALDEHTGPKGQIILEGTDTPIWFSAIKQVFAYTVLPEEPKTLRAIYVNDMAGAERGQPPDPAAWIDARNAHYVIESHYIGGMGAEDAMPFSQRDHAKAFAQIHGGRVVAFHEVPESYIFSQ